MRTEQQFECCFIAFVGNDGCFSMKYLHDKIVKQYFSEICTKPKFQSVLHVFKETIPVHVCEEHIISHYLDFSVNMLILETVV